MLDRARKSQLLDKVGRLVEQKYFNPEFDASKWRFLVETQKPGIVDSESPSQFEQRVHDLVSQLGSSHTAFYHRSGRPLPPRQSICATVLQCETPYGVRWMMQDIQAGGPAQIAGLERGDLLIAIDGEEIMPPAKVLLRPGRRARLRIRRRHGEDTFVGCDVPPLNAKQPFSTPQPVVASRPQPNIGHLKVNMFPGMIGIDVAKDIDHAVASFRDCDRLIVDLRGNSGGGIGALRLMSYLTAAVLPVGYILSRNRARNGYRKEDLKRFGRIPSSKLAIPWLALRYGFGDHSVALFTEGLGPQPFHGRIVMLVNEYSASASEMVVAFAAENRLATILGTTTPGRVVGSKSFKIGDGYFLILPVGGYFTWQGTRIEGTGVRPDSQIGLIYAAAANGLDNQMETALEVVRAM